MTTTTTNPAGYTYGQAVVAASPVSLQDLDELKKSILFTDDDVAALARAGEILFPQTEAILDVWYGFVGSYPHLIATFAGPDGRPDAQYLAAVRRRFGRWIDDLCNRTYNQEWLDYQEEIGLRHHPVGKNRTDGVESTSAFIPMRHLIAFIVPITLTIREFLADGGKAPSADVDAMYHAWFKAVTLTVALWVRPYNPELW